MRALKLGKFFDIEVYIHWTFALLVGYVLYKFWDKGGLEMGLYVVGLLLAMFGCVLLHEFGHALMARYFGVPTRDITLYPIGGVARLERMPERPVEELLIALAGPAVNIVIATLLLVPAFLSISAVADSSAALEQVNPQALEQAIERSFLFQLFAGNLILAGFNLLPAFPMDGGRVLRALLAGWLGRIRATEVAAALGVAFALGFIVIGFYANPMMILLGLFAMFAGQQELAMVRRRAAFAWSQPQYAIPANDADIVDAIPAESYPGTRPGWETRTGGWIVIDDGRTVRKIWIE
jgi:Zn-dependent protease